MKRANFYTFIQAYYLVQIKSPRDNIKSPFGIRLIENSCFEQDSRELNWYSISHLHHTLDTSLTHPRIIYNTIEIKLFTVGIRSKKIRQWTNQRIKQGTN